ncbi:MAG: HET domain-containing protein [Candidatus Moeniiplasma glomeromycotorum]|nr:HET domain-containing protein [Candidatus Moeniiplasma glomeromycotorum]MCE8169329.1 HET domain-containing protein [Candidatus Moeniiplasma glomeromycotorum]
MTNWKEHGNPFLDFTEEITQEWEEWGFNKKSCKEWLDIGMCASDSGYSWWLKSVKKVDPEWVLNYGNEEELRSQYKEFLEELESHYKNNEEEKDKVSYRDSTSSNHNEKKLERYSSGNNEEDGLAEEKISKFTENWKEIHPDFTQLLQEKWEELGFSYKEVKEWISAGLRPSDFKQAQWSRDLGECDILSVPDYSEEEILTKKYIEYLKSYDHDKEKENLNNDSDIKRVEYSLNQWIKKLAGERGWGSVEKVILFSTEEGDICASVVVAKNSLYSFHLVAYKLDMKSKIWWVVTNESPVLFNESKIAYKTAKLIVKKSKIKVDWINKRIEVVGEKDEVLPHEELSEIIQGTKGWDWYDSEHDFNEKKQKQWEKEKFDYQSAKEWIKVGLRTNDYEFAVYLRDSNFTPQKYSNFESKNAQEWLNFFYPKEKRSNIEWVNINSKNLEGRLDLSDFVNLKWINVSGNKITELDIRKCVNLKQLNCCQNQLTSLNINSVHQLEGINCANNLFTNLNFLSSLSAERLTFLDLENNDFFEQDLACFQRFTNLKHLSIGNNKKEKIEKGIYNRFCGSLEPLKNLNELKILYIDNTDISFGLEYLPESLENFSCSNKQRSEAEVEKVYGELLIYGGNLKAWKEAHPELMGEKKIVNPYNKAVAISTAVLERILSLITIQLDNLNKKINKDEENYNAEGINYKGIAFRDKRPFSWEVEQEEKLSTKNLPLKLYNIKENKVEWTKDNPNIKTYATLSYVWGDVKDKSLLEKMRITYQKGKEEKEEKLIITKWGKKSLKKAVNTCKLLGIDYLWMDQLCINQKDKKEKAEEVKKMRKCYGESEVTLISINIEAEEEKVKKENKRAFATETLRKIINSQWFSRSWTYQEGFLSEQTIFMFDDCLVDGRIMAQIWASFPLQKDGHYEFQEGSGILNEEPEVFITPMGWTYHKYQYESMVNYFLNSSNLDKECYKKRYEKSPPAGLPLALRSIRRRKRSNPIDSIYSVLGLLEYGEQIEVKYKARFCSKCPNQEETRNCIHDEENKRYPIYTKEELEETLLDVMKIAISNGYLEPLSWFGPRRNEPYLWWIPQIDENHSFNVRWGVEVRCGSAKVNTKENIMELMAFPKFTKNGVNLIGSYHIIEYLGKGSYSGKDDDIKDELVWLDEVHIENNSISFWENTIWGDKETLKRVKSGDILIIPNEKQMKSNDVKLAILIPSETNVYCPIDIVWFREDEGIKCNNKIKEKWLFIDMVNKKVVKLEDVSSKLKTREAKKQVEKLLETQEYSTKFFAENSETSNPLFKNQLNGIKKEVGKFLTTEEIELICWFQEESSKAEAINSISKQIAELGILAAFLPGLEEQIKEKNMSLEKQISDLQIQIPFWNENWILINPWFDNKKVRSLWASHFTWKEAKDWFMAIPSLNPHQDCYFALWLRDTKQITAERILDNGGLEQLKVEYHKYNSELEQQRENFKKRGEQIIKGIKDKLPEIIHDYLDELLEAQEENIRNVNSEFAENWFEKTQESLYSNLFFLGKESIWEEITKDLITNKWKLMQLEMKLEEQRQSQIQIPPK